MRLALADIFFVRVAQFDEFRMAIECVVVHGDLAVQRHELAVAGDDQRVDLGQAGVGVEEDLVEPLRDLDEGGGVLLGQADAVGQDARQVRLEPQERVRRDLDDLVGHGGGDFLDVHAAFTARHEHDAPAGTVEHGAEIDLLADVGGGVDEHLLHRQPLDRHAENLVGALLGLAGRLGELDAAGLAAPADQHLRLDHDWAAQPHGNVAHLSGRVRDFAARHGNAVLGKNPLGLIFV